MDTEKADSIAGFRSFWEKTKREAAHRNLTFVQVEDGVGSRRPRKKRETNDGATNLEEQHAQSKSPVDEGRRNQVYQAQKRHRDRKKDYCKSLRSEKEELLLSVNQIKASIERLSTESEHIKEVLASHGIDPTQNPVSASSTNPEIQAGRSLSIAESNTGSRSGGEADSKRWYVLEEGAEPQAIECRKLLLRDVEVYGSDEQEEKVTWNSVAGRILDRM